MPKYATLPWIVGASVLGFWEGLAANHDHAHGTLPGGACLLSSSNCCEAWSDNFDSIQSIAHVEHGKVVDIVVTGNSHAPACSLLGFTANITAMSGVCGAPDPGMNVSAAMMQHGLLPSQSLVGRVVEAGSCQDLADGSCWHATDGFTSHVQWTNIFTYEEHEIDCSQTPVVNGTVRSAAYCSATEPLGLQLRASWVYGGSLCDSSVPADLDVQITADDWTHDASMAGLPQWTCRDIPNTPAGQVPHRVVVYSLGHPPCMPPATSSTTIATDDGDGETVANGSGFHKLHGLIGMAILACSLVSGKQ